MQHINSQKEGTTFIDSLKKAGVDSVVGYFYWTSLGPRPYHIYWKKNGMGYLVKIDAYARYNIIGVCDFTGLSPTILADLHIDAGHKNDSALTSCDDCPGENMCILWGKDSIAYDMSLIQGWYNEWSVRKLFIDKFRSYLYLEESSNEWKALNFKRGKLRTIGWFFALKVRK